MIEILIRQRAYTIEELARLYKRYSIDKKDFDEFLSAMRITKQLVEREGKYEPAKVYKEKTLAKPYVREFEARLAGGRPDIPHPRLGIRVLTREKEKVYPTKLTLIQYQDEKGRWVDIVEKPSFSIQKPRSKYEMWRAEVVGFPKEARKKYDIRVATPGRPGSRLRVLIEGTIEEYFARLILWGYNVESMITFGETMMGKNPRDLELHGYDFPYETNGKIKQEIEYIGGKSINVMLEWLKVYDGEYYSLFTYCDYAGKTSPIPGVSYDPLTKPSTKKTRIQLIDHNAKTVRTERCRVSAKLPLDWHTLSPSTVASYFIFEVDDIKEAKGYKGRSDSYRKLQRGQATLEELFGGIGEGFKKKR